MAVAGAPRIQTWWQEEQRRKALLLDKLDRRMRAARSEVLRVRTRVEFFAEAVRSHALDSLNELAAEYLQGRPRSMLSERSFNLVLEDGDTTVAVVQEIIAMAEGDPEFKAQLIGACGASYEYWCAMDDQERGRQPSLF